MHPSINTTVVSRRYVVAFALAAACAVLTLHSEPAWAAVGGGLDSITARIDEVNSWLVALGSVFAVTGFIWAILAFMGRLGGFSSAVTVLFAGMAVANAKQVVGFFIG